MAYAQFHGITLAEDGRINSLHVESVDTDPPVTHPGRLWYNRQDKRVKFTTIGETGALVVLSFTSLQEMAQALSLKLDKSEYTPENILAMIKLVDGPGSELNADRLDGLQAGDFASYRQGLLADSAVQPEDLSTAAYRDLPEAGDAAPDQVVLGTDTRLTDTRHPKAHTHTFSDVPGLADDLASKVDKIAGKGLSTEDYTTAEKTKLAGLQPGAEVNPEIVDGLTSTATDKPLSANQGRVLKGFVDTINDLLTSSDTTLDDLQEIVDYIKLNRETLETLGIGSIAGLQAALDGKQPVSEVLTGTTASFTVALLNKLNGIEAGATGDQTAAEIIALLKTVDGAGSDLDADTLDGLHATAFATATQGGKADTAVQPGDLSVVATTGQYSDLLGKPALGTASPKNVPATGNAASGEVVLGNDTRLTDARDPKAHTHAITDVTGLQTALNGKEPSILTGTTANYWRGDKSWRDFFTDVRAATLTGLSTATNAVITATDTVLGALGKLQKQVTDNLTALTNHTGNTSNPHGTTAAHVGADPVGTATQVMITHTGAVDPHTQYLRRDEAAGGATQLATPRTFTIGNTGKSFDGTANVSWTLDDIGAAASSHSHDAGNITSGTLNDARLPARLGTVAQSITDWNAATSNGWYMSSTAANAPDGSWFIGSTENHGALGWCTQTVHAFSGDTEADTKTYRREQNNGAWGTWYRLRLSQAEQSAIYLNASNINAGTLPVARLPAATLTVNDTIDCGEL